MPAAFIYEIARAGQRTPPALLVLDCEAITLTAGSRLTIRGGGAVATLRYREKPAIRE